MDPMYLMPSVENLRFPGNQKNLDCLTSLEVVAFINCASKRDYVAFQLIKRCFTSVTGRVRRQ